MIKIDPPLLDKVSEEAKKSSRKRMNYNFHKQASDPLQRLLNAMEPGTYVRPHKHESPDKREVFFVVRGRLLVIQFDEQGKITDHVILDHDAGCIAAEISERTYHTVISLKVGTVAYEVKDGPYDVADDKNFACWAPEEVSDDATAYLDGLLKQLAITI
jgi:cupin fold WbuC family metalloprotein